MTYQGSTDTLTRRGLLKGATALGAAALILPATFRQARAEPKRGGTIRLGIASGSTTQTLDPGIGDTWYTVLVNSARSGYLTEVAADGSLIGEVAESWESSPDAKNWTFKLRKGITFHSGGAVKAADVIASINYHRGKDSKSAAKPIVDPIADIKEDGDTIVFTLQTGNADFPFLMSDYHLAILPAADGKIDPLSHDGCGGYILDVWDPGVTAKLKRYPDYWKSDRAWFDAVEINSILDPAARLNALMTGEVDLIDQVDRNTINLLKQAPGVKVLSTTGTQHYCFPMDTRVAPFSDNNVRMALKFGIDRQEMVDKVLGGYGIVGNDHPIGPSNRYFFKELEQRAYDADKAKFYLKQAGLDTLSVKLSAADAAFTGAVDAATLYAEKAAAAGITIDIVREPNDGYWENIWLKAPWCAASWGGRPTEDWMFTTAYSSGAPWNETHWEHARFNELLLAARSELDEGKRREMYHDMQKICADEGGVVIPMFASYVLGVSDKLGHPETIAANWMFDGFRALERWWFV